MAFHAHHEFRERARLGKVVISPYLEELRHDSQFLRQIAPTYRNEYIFMRASMKTHAPASSLCLVFRDFTLFVLRQMGYRCRKSMSINKKKELAATVALLLLVLVRSAAAVQIPAAVAAPQLAAGQALPTEAITLDEAIKRSQASDTTLASAVADNAVAQARTGIARSSLLPGVVYHNQYLYTQSARGSGKPVTTGSSSPVFIANNGVHEYISQASITETMGASGVTDLRKAGAEAAAARARLDVARRGLVSSVVTNFYAVLVADEKVDIQQRALDEALHFHKISGQLEAGGEVAHADTVKANLEVQQRQRDLGDAQLDAQKARLDLAVLLFANPLTPYTVAGDLQHVSDLPQRDQINAAAKTDNPDLKAAIASFHAASLEVTSARFDYLPSLSLNFSYGIDAAQFALNAPDGSHNLGYAAFATLDIPVWDWFATRDRVRQSVARRELAKVELTSTQRRLVASIEELYREAEVTRAQMASLDASVRDATEALRLTDLRYTNGEAPILEVVDAQNTLITMQNSRADGVARYNTALANLQTLTGNLP
jgi:outer membrane protein